MNKFLMLILMFNVFVVTPQNSVVAKKQEVPEQKVVVVQEEVSRPKIAIVKIENVTNIDDIWDISKLVVQAVEQSDGILFHISCSGGSLSLYHTLIDAIKKICKDKSNIAYIENASSCGYSAACSSSYLICNPFGVVGSIGTAYFYSLQKDTKVFQCGDYKKCGNDLTKDQKSLLKKSLQYWYDLFCNIISESRNLNIEEKDVWANGKDFTAPEALRLGLIDEIGYFIDAVNKMKGLLKDKGLNVDNGVELLFDIQR